MKKVELMLMMMMMMVIMVHHICNLANSSQTSDPLVKALYIFGDSLFDSGNNNLLPTLAKANFPPYGVNFKTGPTGRFTNARTVADFIAEYVGVPYPKAYLSIGRRRSREGEDNLRGLNYASGSCGILPQTGSDLGKCLNLGEQIDMFERTVKEEVGEYYGSSEEVSNYLSKSLFIVSIGSNDYINNYLDTKRYDTSKHYSPQSFANLLIQNLSQHFQKLYGLGARKVVMFEIGPIGCIPSSTRQFKHTGRCVEDINQLALIFNNNLSSLLLNLTSTLQGSSFILGHAHWLGYDAIINPSTYGLSDSSNPCCLTWFNGTSGCIPEPWAMTCQHPEKHYFFDGYHLTETVYKTIATLCFNGSSVCFPKNIKDLVSQV